MEQGGVGADKSQGLTSFMHVRVNAVCLGCLGLRAHKEQREARNLGVLLTNKKTGIWTANWETWVLL
jgi:hypothetical protein